MGGKIFINYRRGDDPGFAGRLFDRLEEAFTSDRLFLDIDSIEPGLDFVRVLEEQVDKCDVFLAVIGLGWIDARDETGSRRLDDPNDFVRIEIESGLKLGKRIIPVLVNNAAMPRAEHLPESLKPLSFRNAVRLTHERFKADAQGLVKQLEKALHDVEVAREAAATNAAAAEAKRLAEEELAKAAELERRERERQAKTVAGLSPEQIAKAEELANWEFIKESESPQDFRDHLARFPKGVTLRMARAKLEAIVWNALGETPGLEALEAFLAEFPDGKHTAKGKEQRDALKAEADAALAEENHSRRETEAWAAASAADTREAYEVYLRDWPSSQHAKAARNRLRKIASATPQARTARWSSWIFVIMVVPCQLFLARVLPIWVLKGAPPPGYCDITLPSCVKHPFSQSGDTIQLTVVGTGFLIGFAIALGSAAALAYRTRAVLTGGDIFRYWLGCSFALWIAVSLSLTPAPWGFGNALAWAITLASAVVLAIWRRAPRKNDGMPATKV